MVDNAFPMVEIKERPTLFSTEMVRAILDGRKTMTRRIVSANNSFFGGLYGLKFADLDFNSAKVDHLFAPVYLKVDLPAMETRHRIFPKYDVGDILWVREEHYCYGFWQKNGTTKTGKQKYTFRSSDEWTIRYSDDPPPRVKKNSYREFGWYKRLGRFMPKSYARIFLEITNIKVERLQDISEEDAKAEGAEQYPFDDLYKQAFERIWVKINGEESWNANPWVWVIEFKILSTTGRPQ